jgi:hypothetical protein
MRRFYLHSILISAGFGLLAACSEEPLPRSVNEFMKEPLMLDAAMVRCLQNRLATRYDAECVNARQAAQLIEAKETRARRAELEARSLRKRQALRRTQNAANEARRRAVENQRRREEAEYVALFGPAPSADGGQENDYPSTVDFRVSGERESGTTQEDEIFRASDGGNVPIIDAASEATEAQTGLESVRDELKRRNDQGED